MDGEERRGKEVRSGGREAVFEQSAAVDRWALHQPVSPALAKSELFFFFLSGLFCQGSACATGFLFGCPLVGKTLTLNSGMVNLILFLPFLGAVDCLAARP